MVNERDFFISVRERKQLPEPGSPEDVAGSLDFMERNIFQGQRYLKLQKSGSLTSQYREWGRKHPNFIKMAEQMEKNNVKGQRP